MRLALDGKWFKQLMHRCGVNSSRRSAARIVHAGEWCEQRRLNCGANLAC